MVQRLLKKADNIEFIVTRNESDALYLEYNLIQTHRPPYNIKLKDDRGFPYIMITRDNPFPGIYITRKREAGPQLYFGPLLNKQMGKGLIDIISRLFQLRTCSNRQFAQSRGCLYQHIDRCAAPCLNGIRKEDYQIRVEQAIEFLRGNQQPIICRLQAQMQAFAQMEEYEKAQKIKEDIRIIQDTDLNSYITTTSRADYDVIAFQQDQAGLFLRLSIRDGKVQDRYFYDFETLDADENILKAFFVSCYHRDNLPAEIVLPRLPPQADALQALFGRLVNRKFRFTIPRRGVKKALLQLALDNLHLQVVKNSYQYIGHRLKQALSLQNFPSTIECFDISHMAEQQRVGAMVCYVNGTARKKNYRSYLIKTAGKGDLEALKEVLNRRFKNKSGDLPDLIIIDGGMGQLQAGLEVKKALHLPVDLVSLAKREERVFLESGRTVLLPEGSPQKFLFQNIRDEAHRRAVTHHRKRREKATLS